MCMGIISCYFAGFISPFWITQWNKVRKHNSSRHSVRICQLFRRFTRWYFYWSFIWLCCFTYHSVYRSRTGDWTITGDFHWLLQLSNSGNISPVRNTSVSHILNFKCACQFSDSFCYVFVSFFVKLLDYCKLLNWWSYKCVLKLWFNSVVFFKATIVVCVGFFFFFLFVFSLLKEHKLIVKILCSMIYWVNLP